MTCTSGSPGAMPYDGRKLGDVMRVFAWCLVVAGLAVGRDLDLGDRPAGVIVSPLARRARRHRRDGVRGPPARDPATAEGVTVTDRLGRVLLVTLEAARVNADVPVLETLRSWLDSWRGIGDVERGMERQGFDLQLTRYDEKGWRAKFYTSGMEHSITSATASAWELTPWHAVQGAAREALRKAGAAEGEPYSFSRRRECGASSASS